MCGRYVSPEQAAVERFFHIGGRNTPNPFKAHYNAAPTQMLPVIRVHPEHGKELAVLKWGLIPSWAKDAGIGSKMINARGETVAEKPSFRAAFKRRRCLVPMAGFYEWRKMEGVKQPYFIHLKDAEQCACAGLYEWWPGKDGAEPIESYTIVTTDANEMMRPLHDRMPVILHERDYDQWIDPKNENTTELQKLIAPYESEAMTAYPVSTAVNNVRNQGPELIAPLAA